MRLGDRGYLRADAFADVLVFDPEKFRDQSTFEKPGVYATGVRYLFINGKPAIDDGKPQRHSAGECSGTTPRRIQKSPDRRQIMGRVSDALQAGGAAWLLAGPGGFSRRIDGRAGFGPG